VEIIAVRHILRIVRFARSPISFVPLYWGMVSLRMISHCIYSVSSTLFLNSPLQSACTCWTRWDGVTSRILIMLIGTLPTWSLVFIGFTIV
jgi:hypothetical protein